MANPRGVEAGRRRTCVGCRKTAHPSQLVRIARAPDGSLALGTGPGRGAWVCAQPATAGCFDEAVKRGALGRALRSELTKVELEELREKLLRENGG